MSSTSGPGPSYASLFKNRSFTYLWLGQLISQSGDAVFDIALLWLVLVETGSTALVGLAQAAVLIPAVLASPFAGVYADRTNRRTVMVISNLFQGTITLFVSLLYASDSLNFSLLILFVLLLYSGAQFYRAASNAIIPSIVSRENLGAANGLFSLSQSFNQLLGYTVGGIVILALGPVVPITYDSLTFFVAAGLLMMVAKPYGRPRVDAAIPVAKSSFARDFREGMGFIRRSRIFLQLIFFGLVINSFGSAFTALLAPYAKFWVHGDASTYGFLSAAFALGLIVGSVVVGRVNFRSYVGRLLFFGVVAFGALLALAGLVTTIPVALALFAAMGAILAVVNVPINALVQTQVPNEMLGRAGTALTASLTAAQPVASILAGVLAAFFSIGSVIIASGVAVAATAVVLYPFFRELRDAKF
ncbi:MAG TPA: MFS transporter [Nitrososphaerales archaeon]|nr:MFS transporter [Nitrososphaerales archaeon]